MITLNPAKEETIKAMRQLGEIREILPLSKWDPANAELFAALQERRAKSGSIELVENLVSSLDEPVKDIISRDLLHILDE
jgi:hypothetical protein